jgi:hypothetical protein
MGRTMMIVLAILVAALVGYACWPRKADLRVFDPAAMARLETAMWRDYYERRYPALFAHLYEPSRAEFGFSPLTSLRIALSAAQAARIFQPTRSRAEAEAAIPDLVTYFGLLREAAPVAFDPREVAARELDWWQAGRESVGPQDYGVTIGQVAALTYGKEQDEPALRAFGIGRAEAMAYRDTHGQAITERDWSTIETQLRDAYRLLKSAISN